MDLLRSHKRRSRLSNVLYIVLNVALAVAMLLVVRYGQSGWLAVGLVLLSKWRALAVKPRFWLANIMANLVDVIVGVSTVALLYAAAGQWPAQIIITALYVAWLLLLKPRSGRAFVAAQSGVSVFLGTTALAAVSYSWDVLFMVLFMWLIGYAASRHILGDYDEPLSTVYSLTVGFIFAELAWIAHHWLFAYTVPGGGAIKIPQLALVVTLVGFASERAYSSYARHGRVRRQDVLLPFLLAGGVMVVLLLFFNKIALNQT